MKRRPDPEFRVLVAAVLSVSVLILWGYVILLLNPPTELDRKCLPKPLAEIGECIRQHGGARHD